MTRAVPAPRHGWTRVALVFAGMVVGSWIWLGLDYPAHLVAIQTTLHDAIASALR